MVFQPVVTWVMQSSGWLISLSHSAYFFFEIRSDLGPRECLLFQHHLLSVPYNNSTYAGGGCAVTRERGVVKNVRLYVRLPPLSSSMHSRDLCCGLRKSPITATVDVSVSPREEEHCEKIRNSLNKCTTVWVRSVTQLHRDSILYSPTL